MHDAGHRYCAGIHHRVKWKIGARIEHDSVKCVAAWLNSDARQYGITTDQFERETVDKGL
jgi:hypothetical protein